ncbi:protein phosphatase type 1 complex subunit Hex2/Reg1, putative [Cordyceps militaris CM01]|uniref:Protein phosphatase type 1 complex subunit Hex2/Reg1, putative n=2 Tax=Cordyceps militaris TaxID=73501 RepID=G3JLF1_CORMM|nr:protein phosphatase type 1 complex subunit Hex2/Reg1, putative [Cordyceps militaris CM01]ATY63089.1 phosphatase type 1 complex subunit Hex2 [Cordyceps militaris]EGX90525.1 protein phosphatase type 1 complex subunit Hex2/Reg1, putative [Cordyceps militaris CM01]
MAVVISSEDNYFSSSSLRRSASQTKFDPSTFSTSTNKIHSSYDPSSKSSSESDASSVPSSPRTIHAEATDLSYSSTPATNLSIASDFDDAPPLDDSPEDHFGLPPFSDEKYYMHPHLGYDNDEDDGAVDKAPSAQSYCAVDDSSESTSRPETPELAKHAEDDTTIASKPSRQVDYLSHDWKEEDIWTSWRYIVTRRGEVANSARLENASWRTWMKAKHNLKTISPESLNWLKDCDVTWLYGPLQCKPGHLYGTHTEPCSSALSKTDSLINLQKKPILKKRSMSEVMLQRSILSASLLKQAAAAVHAQERRGILTNKSKPDDYIAVPLSSRHLSVTSNSTAESIDSSGLSSPCNERKHIHFNEKVEQCIAVEIKGDDEDIGMEAFDDGEQDSDSDDGFMMKRVKSKKRSIPARKIKSKRSAGCETIATLPPTTLKYRGDTPEPLETAMKHSRSPILSPSSSQETLRPTKQANRFYFGEEDDEDNDTSVIGSGWRSPPMESAPTESSGLHRTSSGMLMPYEAGENPTGEGIIGRVIDTVNTARDIAHVIWNVGWRK